MSSLISRSLSRRVRGVIVGVGAVVCISVGATVGASTAYADGTMETEIYAISRGGMIYDNWMSALEADKPGVTHPSYPAAGKKSGDTTWRCKECHGWDYKGKDGAYSKGSHFTGIPGIRDWVGRNPAEVIPILRNSVHQFSSVMISDSAAEKLALFVTRGQIDMDQYIDRATKTARGDSARGARFYQTICAICHGFDGKDINFKDDASPEYVGTVSQDNPWETLHKIRNGQPGVPMAAMTALSPQDQVDILAYTQTLPAK